MNKQSKGSIPMPVGITILILLAVLGAGTGFLLARQSSGGAGAVGTSADAKTATAGVDQKKTFGSSDTTTFNDQAIGVVEKDGIGGEGTHKLIREGGPTQTACMVSSVLDLNDFVGKKIKVWGNCQAPK